MSIQPYLPEAAFDEETTAAMDRAFNAACTALNVLDDDERSRRIVAKRIVDLARRGIVSAKPLADRVIAESKYTL